VTEATTAIFGGILPSRSVANGDLDQLAAIASDAEDLTEADEEDEEDLDSEDEEDPKVKALDAYMLPPTRPGWVNRTTELLKSQQAWDEERLPVGEVDFVHEDPEMRSSLGSLRRRQRAQSLPSGSGSSPKHFPSSPPSPGTSRHQSAATCSRGTPSKPEESETLLLDTPTPFTCEGQRPLGGVKRYHLRPVTKLPTTKSLGQANLAPQQPTNRLATSNKRFLGRPPKRRWGNNKQKDVPVCDLISRSYVPHTDIPLSIVNPRRAKDEREDKHFDLFQ
jgi:hypothetical protein